MAIVLTQTATNTGSGTNPSITLSNSIAVGDLIMYTYALPAPILVPVAGSPSDTLGNTYTDFLSSVNSAGIQIQSFIVISAFAGASTTISGPILSGSYNYVIHARVYSGVASPTYLDSSVTGTASGGSPQSNNPIGPTSNPNCKLVGFYAYTGAQDNSVATAYSGGVTTQNEIQAYNTIGMVSSDGDLGTPSSNTMSVTFTGANKNSAFLEYALIDSAPPSGVNLLPLCGVS